MVIFKYKGDMLSAFDVFYDVMLQSCSKEQSIKDSGKDIWHASFNFNLNHYQMKTNK